MAPLHRFVGGLRGMLRKKHEEQNLDDELRAYLDTAIEQKMSSGMSREDAVRAARSEMRSLEAAKDYVRDAGWESRVESVWLDVRHAVRALRKAPGFAAVAILTLALGIGANTAIFSVVNAVLLKPLPYSDADRLVRLFMNVPADRSPSGTPLRFQAGMSDAEIDAIRSRARTLSHISPLGVEVQSLSGYDNAARLVGSRISASLLDRLGARSEIGRTLDARDEARGAQPVMLVSHGTWQRYFGRDPATIGRTVTLENVLGRRHQTRATIVGVMPPEFAFPDSQTQFWMPLQADADEIAARGFTPPPQRAPEFRRASVAQLAENASPEAAATEVAGVLRALRTDDRMIDAATFDFVRLQDGMVAEVKPALLVLTVAVGFVLLIACINVANLLLARTAGRHREIAIRAAIGAGHWRLLRQALTESVVLALIGAAGGIVLAFGGIRLLRALATTLGRLDVMNALGFPRLDEIGIDGRVLAFTLATSVLTGVLFGLAPAMHSWKARTIDALKEGGNLTASIFGGSQHGTTGNILVLAEISLAMVLLVASALLMRSFVNLSATEPGFNASGVVTFQVSVPTDRYSNDAQVKALADRLVEHLESLPGVQGAAYGRQLPMVALQDTLQIRRTAAVPQGRIMASDARLVSSRYLDVMGIRVIAGRSFVERDGSRGVLINEALAARDFAGENPLGQAMYIGPEPMPWVVTGIVANVRQRGLTVVPDPQFFVDIDDWTQARFPLFPLGPYYAVRTDNPEAVVISLRGMVRTLDPQAALFNVATMDQLVAATIARPRMYSVLLGIFASVGVALAVIGIYGVMAYSVTRRTREIGIRVALGARRGEVLRLVLGQTIVLAGIGIMLGLGGAAMVTRYLEGMLFGLTPLDPATFIAVSLVFVAVAALAAFVPARRATAVNPLVALRSE